MEIIDAQVHVWQADRPTRPWISSYREQHRDFAALLINSGQSMTGEQLLIEMAEAGVDAAVLAPNGVYGTDNSFQLASARRFPRKYAVVGWVDHLDPQIAETLEGEMGDGLVAIRMLALREHDRLERREFDAVLAACERLGLGVSFTLTHPIPDELERVIARFEGINFTIDHLGVGLAPPLLGPSPSDPFANLPAALTLARHGNVSMKLSGVAALSHERFPFRDVFPAVRQVLDAFGVERVMWGSDFTRTAGLHSYWDATHYLSAVDGLTADELEWIYGRSLRSILRWDPPIDALPRL